MDNSNTLGRIYEVNALRLIYIVYAPDETKAIELVEKHEGKKLDTFTIEEISIRNWHNMQTVINTEDGEEEVNLYRYVFHIIDKSNFHVINSWKEPSILNITCEEGERGKSLSIVADYRELVANCLRQFKEQVPIYDKRKPGELFSRFKIDQKYGSHLLKNINLLERFHKDVVKDMYTNLSDGDKAILNYCILKSLESALDENADKDSIINICKYKIMLSASSQSCFERHGEGTSLEFTFDYPYKAEQNVKAFYHTVKNKLQLNKVILI